MFIAHAESESDSSADNGSGFTTASKIDESGSQADVLIETGMAGTPFMLASKAAVECGKQSAENGSAGQHKASNLILASRPLTTS